MLKKRIREIRPDALLIGEVWEDASNKIAYGVRRRYFVDGVLDSCMNYPFRNAILNFMKGNDRGHGFEEAVTTVLENYPPQVVACNMNLLGTPDTTRILTARVDDFDGRRDEKAKRHLSPEQKEIAGERLLMASFLQYMLPGSPSIYYGDETCMEGYKDPFNRRTYPWGGEDLLLVEHFRQLGQLKKQPALQGIHLEFFQAWEDRIGFKRTCADQKLKIYVNRSDKTWEIPTGKLLMGHKVRNTAPTWMELEPMGFCVMEV